jgi:glyoxylase-like metal-dependent hydrolase (beta-lactamase superfamily II)
MAIAFYIGHIWLDVLEMPGHTLEHISLSLTDTASGEGPVAVFTGDTLFIGDVGHTDFHSDRAEEVAGMLGCWDAGMLYDSLHNKLLPPPCSTFGTPMSFALATCLAPEHLYVGKLSNFLVDLPRGQSITTFCGSGQRAVIAGSVLQNAGFRQWRCA